jgi:hypothetical protein
MKPLALIQFPLLAAMLALGVAGCATPNVNPPLARAGMGYVDFHADSADILYWQVERFDDRAPGYQKVYSELDPPAGGFLRLAFAPGHYRLRVTVLNRVVREPGVVEVEIKDGMITPVNVQLIPDGTAQVQLRNQRAGSPTAGGGHGRRIEYSSSESILFRLSAVAEPPTPYRVKAQTSYAH